MPENNLYVVKRQEKIVINYMYSYLDDSICSCLIDWYTVAG
jgi:hypothetical protein